MRFVKRMTVFIIVAVIFCLGTTSGAFLLKLHLGNAKQQEVALSLLPRPQRDQRILVFAPHCDDETLGTGGAIAEAVEAGAKVHVTLMTNGDGFTMAVTKSLHHLPTSADDYIRFATRRQKETLKALSVLGLSSNNVTFLGYPDRGLAPMWNVNWTPDHLYRSHYTGRTYSPYTDSLRLGAPYCGMSVLADVEQTIDEFHPTDIYMPHPNDEHPDHWATNCYVNAALQDLQKANKIKTVQIHTYLVHRGDWPVPQGLHRTSRLVPPQPLTNLGTQWKALSLEDGVMDKKHKAILCYHSQTAVMRRFLLSFARRNELFGNSRIVNIAHVPGNRMQVDGYHQDWYGIHPVVEDPIKDKLARELQGSGDIRALYLAEDGNNLYLRTDTRTGFSKRVTYRFRLHLLTDYTPELKGKQVEITIQPPTKTASSHNQFAWNENTLETSIPLKEIAPAQYVYVSVETQVGRIALDRSAWQLTRINKEPHGRLVGVRLRYNPAPEKPKTATKNT